MNDNVLLIGASGFVGTRLLETAIADFNIKNLDKQQSHFYPEITQIGDVRDQQALDQALVGFDTVVLLAAMEKNGVKNIIFTSSVAVYGLNKHNPDENHPHDPFNHYGKSKWQAEEVLREWYNKAPTERSLTIIRPTVIFGERNRGNVYNLLKQIAGGKFMMVGAGTNYKSMAYVGNIVEFIKYKLKNVAAGYEVYNYVDKPDLNMNQLVAEVEQSLNKKIPSMHLPYPLGMLGGYCFDILSKITGKKYAISSVRVKKFCATTQFDATKVHSSGFVAPYTLSQGLDRTLQYEFVHAKKDDITFVSE
ncbi:NAD-dependent epimerase/dehydratase family protein [Escherichia coli]|uniref:NAD-dependent epimerase/dehydratase family protein n=1 Tax=Escherichia coli TaxID=562 RepID=UPI0003C0C14E|nr:NAD-dependent epimerase/dehydratase family protein [Escherichia coli]ESP44848.1 UDP-N-acetylglucosamine 4-epimerase [Escherichia coli HVH 108 (4-6924867)]